MLRLFSLFVAGTAALHIIEDKKSVSSAKTEVKATVHKKPLRKSVNLANSFAALSHARKVKQEPTEEAAEEPPAGDLPIDEEGYAADWGTEHRSDAYPPESVGKQHHPNYDQTAAKIARQLGTSWWWWLLALLIVVAIVGGYMYYKKK